MTLTAIINPVTCFRARHSSNQDPVLNADERLCIAKVLNSEVLVLLLASR